MAQQHDDLLFPSVPPTRWIVSDQIRLQAVDKLVTRTLEYHNNIHRRVIYNRLLVLPSHQLSDDTVAYCASTAAPPPRSNNLDSKHFQTVTRSALPDTLQLIRQRTLQQQEGKGHLSWVHLLDLSPLSDTVRALELDPQCTAHFIDMRHHSSMVPTMDGCCMSLCYFQMDEQSMQVHLFKLYFYLSKGLVLTYVVELMPELQGRAVVGSHHVSSSNGSSSPPQLLEDHFSPIDVVCNAVFDRWERSVSRIEKYDLGPLFVFCELAQEAITAHDSLMEFLSRTLFFFKYKTSFRLTYRRKTQFMRRSHVVQQALTTLEANTARVLAVVADLKAAAAGGSMNPSSAWWSSSVLHRHDLAAIHDLHSNFVFMQDCLQAKVHELAILKNITDGVSILRANNGALVLSLIATIFLPATFLAGVFGMNFQKGSAYSIGLLNVPYGPTVFYSLCGAITVLFSCYYLYVGWIEPFYSVRLLLKLLLGKQLMMAILGYDIETDDYSDIESFDNISPTTLPDDYKRDHAVLTPIVEGDVDDEAVDVDDEAAAGIRNPVHPSISSVNTLGTDLSKDSQGGHHHHLNNRHSSSSLREGFTAASSVRQQVMQSIEEDAYRQQRANTSRLIAQQQGTTHVRELPSNYRFR